jgi:hypothetical protein
MNGIAARGIGEEVEFAVIGEKVECGSQSANSSYCLPLRVQ